MRSFGIDEIQAQIVAQNLTMGKLIKQAREKCGYDLQQVVTKMKLTKSYISHIENDDVIPRINTLHKLAKLLNIDLQLLLVSAGYIKREPQSIGELIRLSMAYDNLTNVKLAKQSGIQKKYLSKIIHEKYKVSQQSLKKLASVLVTVTHEELLEMAGYISNNETLSTKIQNVVNKQGISLSEFAERCKISRWTLYNILNKENYKPYEYTVLCITNVLQDDFSNREEQK